MIKLSIIIPVYNVEQYIEKCMCSVLENDLNADEFEILVIDDETPDNSISKINYLIEKHKNIHLFSQKNKGLGGARNLGINNAKGKYVLFLDADDIVLPNTLKTLINYAIDDDLDVLEFAAKGVKETGEKVYEITNSTHGVIYPGVEYYNSVRYMNSACNKLYKNKFLQINELFFLEKIFIEDFEWNTRVFLKATKIMATDLLVSSFLQTPNSITRNTSKEKKDKMINDIVLVLNKTVLCQSKELEDKNKVLFFEERKSFLVATLFIQLIKNKASYKEIVDLREKLMAENLFFVNFPIFDPLKNKVRKVLLKNIWLYKGLRPILSFIF